MLERSSTENSPNMLGRNSSPLKSVQSASFVAPLAKPDDSSQHGFKVAQADPTTHKQRQDACLSLLNEAHAVVKSLEIAIPQMSPETMENLLRDPGNRRLIEDRLDEADAKLETVKNQCGDVLPKETMDGVADLQKRLKKVRNSIDEALDDPGGDAMKALAGLAELAGKGLLTLLGGIGLLFNLFRGPSYRGAQNDVGIRGSERS